MPVFAGEPARRKYIMSTKISALREKFLQAANHIKNLGFTVYISKDARNTFGYYSDGQGVAYFQQNQHAEGVNVATCNKTPGSSGMHHCLEPNFEPISLDKLTKEYLRKGFAMYPEYFTKEDRDMMPVIKYINLEEFLRNIEPGSFVPFDGEESPVVVS